VNDLDPFHRFLTDYGITLDNLVDGVYVKDIESYAYPQTAGTEIRVTYLITDRAQPKRPEPPEPPKPELPLPPDRPVRGRRRRG